MVKYVNSKGIEIDLSQFPVRLKEAVFHAYEWTYEGAAQRYGIDIDYFKKDPIEYEMIVSFTGRDETKKQQLNDFCEVTEYDVKNNSPGTLYVEEYNIKCFVIASSTEPTEFFRVDRSMRILCPYPFWIKETKYQFFPEGKESQPEINTHVVMSGITEYPLFDLPFDFVGQKGSQKIENPSYAPCNFRMVIYGFVENPTILIGHHIYSIYATALDGERIVIDSRDKTVIKIGRFGEITNLYNSRNKEYSVFEKIPDGKNTISWSGDYGIDLTLFDERSEPKWSSQSAAQT